MKRTTSNLPFFDPELEVKKLTKFIKKTCHELNYHGGVIGLSGGVDSSACAALMVKALGPDKVLGVTIPSIDSDPNDEKDARLVADFLGINIVLHPLARILEHFGVYKYIRDMGDPEYIKQKYYVESDTTMPRDVAYPCIMKLRTRMLILSHYAYKMNYFHCQTLNRSEILLGFYDKFGDAPGDIAPTAHLYKTQLHRLAEFLDIPRRILDREPSSGNFPVTEREELGMGYDEADKILYLNEEGTSIDEISVLTGIDVDDVRRVVDLVSNSRFKRYIPYCVTGYHGGLELGDKVIGVADE